MVLALRRRGYQVVILDNLVYGHRDIVQQVLKAELVIGDTSDRQLLDQLFATYNMSAVMHFAAYAYVGESVTDPAKYYHNNVVGILTLLEAMLAAGRDTFVFSSTCATYGIPQTIPIPETHLIPLILLSALGKRESLQIFGTDYPTRDRTCIRDYIHVSDLAEAHVLGLEYLLQGGETETFNLGNGNGFSIREAIETARQVTGREIPVVEGSRRPGAPPILIGSSDRARKILGWHPRMPI